MEFFGSPRLSHLFQVDVILHISLLSLFYNYKYNSYQNYYYLGDICIPYRSLTILTLTFLFFFFSYIDIYYTKILIWSCLSFLYHLFVNLENQLKGKNKKFWVMQIVENKFNRFWTLSSIQSIFLFEVKDFNFHTKLRLSFIQVWGVWYKTRCRA